MKISTSIPNIANRIARHVAQRFPALAEHSIPGVWFTGSSVWSQLYADIPLQSDWDIFTEDNLAAARLVTGMGWNLLPAFPTSEKRSGNRNPRVSPETNIPMLAGGTDRDGNRYSDGYCYVTPDGDVDVWVTGMGGALQEIRTYPSASHAHCRAAYSMTDGLIVLPNEAAELGVVGRKKAVGW